MKKLLPVYITLILGVLAGCGEGTKAPTNPGPATVQVQAPTSGPQERDPNLEQGRILPVEDWDLALYSLGGGVSMDTQITLKDLQNQGLRSPESRVPGPWPETEIWTWTQGISALVKPQEDSVMSLEVQKPGYFSARNIQVGDPREKVRLAYGLGSNKPDAAEWSYTPDYEARPYPARTAWKRQLEFTFVEGKVSKIKILEQVD